MQWAIMLFRNPPVSPSSRGGSWESHGTYFRLRLFPGTSTVKYPDIDVERCKRPLLMPMLDAIAPLSASLINSCSQSRLRLVHTNSAKMVPSICATMERGWPSQEMGAVLIRFVLPACGISATGDGWRKRVSVVGWTWRLGDWVTGCW